MKPGLSRGWTPHRLARRQPLGSVSSRAKEAVLDDSPGVCSLSPVSQQEASCNPEASLGSKAHLSLFTSLCWTHPFPLTQTQPGLSPMT